MEVKPNLINLDWNLTISETLSQNFMAHKANYTTMMVFFYLTACLLKCEGIQVRIKEMLITKVKKLWKVFHSEQKTNNYQKQNLHLASNYSMVSYISGCHRVTRAPGIFTKHLAEVQAIT